MVAEKGSHTPRSYGEIYTYENSVTLTLTEIGTYYVLTGLTNHISEGVTISGANGTITLENGIYHIDLHTSFAADKVSTIHCSLHLDTVHQDMASFERKQGNANDVGSASFMGIFDVASGVVADIRFKSTAATTELSLTHLQFRVTRYY